jgi:hypothetical protein
MLPRVERRTDPHGKTVGCMHTRDVLYQRIQRLIVDGLASVVDHV